MLEVPYDISRYADYGYQALSHPFSNSNLSLSDKINTRCRYWDESIALSHKTVENWLGADRNSLTYQGLYGTLSPSADAAMLFFPSKGIINAFTFAPKISQASKIIPEAAAALKSMRIGQTIFKSNKAASTANIAQKAQQRSILAGKSIWTQGREGNSAGNALKHWKDHEKDFPNLLNSKEYVEFAHSFIQNTPKGTLMKIRKNGNIILYNPRLNTYGVFTHDKVPKTIFKPSVNKHPWETNLEYFYERP